MTICLKLFQIFQRGINYLGLYNFEREIILFKKVA